MICTGTKPRSADLNLRSGSMETVGKQSIESACGEGRRRETETHSE